MVYLIIYRFEWTFIDAKSSNFSKKRATISHSDTKSINTHVTGTSLSSAMTSAIDKRSHRSTALSKRSVSQLSHSNYIAGNLSLNSILKPKKNLGKF